MLVKVQSSKPEALVLVRGLLLSRVVRPVKLSVGSIAPAPLSMTRKPVVPRYFGRATSSTSRTLGTAKLVRKAILGMLRTLFGHLVASTHSANNGGADASTGLSDATAASPDVRNRESYRLPMLVDAGGLTP